MKLFVTEDLFKAMHKYVKRTGTPGSYQYWYKMPDGSLSAAPDKQEHGKKEHLQRLLAGRMREIHAKTNKQIAEEVGVPQKKVSDKDWGMKRPGQTLHTEHSDHHLHEANTDVTHGSYQGHVEASQTEDSSGSGPARSGRTASSRPAPTRGTEAPAAASPRSTPAPARENRASAEARPARTQTPAAAETTTRTPEQIKQEKRQKLKELFGVDLGASAPASTPAPAQSNDDVIREVFGDSRPAAARAEKTAAEERAIRENVDRANQELAQARTNAARASAATAAPSAPAARELRTTIDDPTYNRDEAALATEIAEQAAGGNPYMTKAKDVFNRISHNVKAERRTTVGHLFQAMDAIKEEGQPVTKATLIAKYNEISGRRVRELGPIGDEFEKATFYTLEEAMTNPPIVPEVERMKRGYAAKQFARAKPFLKDSWLQGNIGAPPPHPTFADFKSWSEHGGVKPAWAGTTRLAVPKEIFDAAPKGADGKPKYPPAWMPLHMMPAWNYAYKKMGSDDAYQATGTGIARDSANQKTGWKMDLGDQGSYQEGMIKSAMRKYVQMRGGADQLTDIPSSKLAEAGITHADIYKSGEENLEAILKHKIIDPIALIPFMKEEIAGMKEKKIKKSFILVIDEKSTFVPKEELRKSELIAKIKELKKSKYVVGKNNLHGA